MSKHIVVHKSYDEELPEISCNPGQINQVIMNIIGNAIDALPGKGNIWISTHHMQGSVCVSIQDDGAGMSPAIQEKIFDPFYTTKEVGSGTGLGLSISYGIVEKHNGKINVESKEGEGTTFDIILPLYHNQNEPL
jgi:signal transduction histidine kinase